MKCALCDKDIKNYNPLLNQLAISDNKEVDLCQECVDKFLKWQQGIFAKLFPTPAVKKRFSEKK